MARTRGRRERPALDGDSLNELALAYVGRFATTRAKLGAYLSRKVRERGWAGERGPDIESVVERLADLGYVDDAGYALSKARSLSARGYGKRRVGQSLRAAGIGEEDGEAALELADSESVESAIRYARRRRIGPFAAEPADRDSRERALAAMIRAGHDFALAKAIIALEPGSEVDLELIAEKS
jgi:regulatory protein